jgi:hypothetical protein
MKEPATFVALSFCVFIFFAYKKGFDPIKTWLDKPAQDLKKIFFSNSEILKTLRQQLNEEKIKNDNINIEIEKVISFGKEKLDSIEKKMQSDFNQHLKSKKNKNDSIIESIKLEFKKEIYLDTVDKLIDQLIKTFTIKQKESKNNFLDLSIASKIIMQEKALKKNISTFIEKN